MEPYDGEAKINTIRKVYQEGDSVILKIKEILSRIMCFSTSGRTIPYRRTMPLM